MHLDFLNFNTVTVRFGVKKKIKIYREWIQGIYLKQYQSLCTKLAHNKK